MPVTVFLAILLACVWLARAESFSGQVVGVGDGDTITVMRDRAPVHVRLSGIDCPEKSQDFGKRAKQATSSYVFGQRVTVNVLTTDRHGRLVADVILPDGSNLSEHLLRDGWAWWFRKYSSDTRLEVMEREARAARRGLWADGHAVPPWEFRQEMAHGRKEKAYAVERAPARPSPAGPAGRADDVVYVTRAGSKYHRAGCRELGSGGIAMRLDQAVKSHTPCSRCRPPGGPS